MQGVTQHPHDQVLSAALFTLCFAGKISDAAVLANKYWQRPSFGCWAYWVLAVPQKPAVCQRRYFDTQQDGCLLSLGTLAAAEFSESTACMPQSAENCRWPTIWTRQTILSEPGSK